MIRSASIVTLAILAGAALMGGGRTEARAYTSTAAAAAAGSVASPSFSVRYQTTTIDGVEIFYREAGPKDGPVILLLHGFPTSSHMFRNLIPALADTYRVIAPDYPGYGNSAMPSPAEFEYSFDNLAKVVDRFTEAVGANRFALYVQDYGAPIGFRIASSHPERITGLIVQNGNAYEEGLRDFWVPFKAYWKDPSAENKAALTPYFELAATKWQWTHGVKDPTTISPDTWTIDQAGMDRPGNKEIQLALFMSYGSNPPLYPKWQEYFRTHQPPTLIVWGKNDLIFPAEGAEPYKRDLKNIDFNLLDTGHFALEEQGAVIAEKIRTFMHDTAQR
jgi:pimeloyl-ACP methyl ester carboxylesterase